jgi:hypothetical protein
MTNEHLARAAYEASTAGDPEAPAWDDLPCGEHNLWRDSVYQSRVDAGTVSDRRGIGRTEASPAGQAG